MMKYLFFPFFLFIATAGFCQFSEIKGKVASRRNREMLAGAFVNCTGGGHHFNTSTDPDGEFKFRNLPMGPYDIAIEYVGYTTYQTHVDLADNKKVELTIQLEEHSKDLITVQVYGKLSQEDQ